MKSLKNNYLKKWEISILLALCVTLCAGTWAQARSAALSEGLVRLHVIAASDSESEQAVKLEVRDAVLAYLAPALDGARSAREASEIVTSELSGVRSAALSASQGREVTVTLSEEYYPTREYEGFTLPAGRYRSLRVVLGEGGGHNWWCVVFPPLCLSAAGAEEALDAMTDEDASLIAGEGEGVVFRFRLVELWGELMARFDGKSSIDKKPAR